MERLRLTGYMPTAITITLRIQPPEQLQTLVEYVEQDFIAVFHPCDFQKTLQIYDFFWIYENIFVILQRILQIYVKTTIMKTTRTLLICLLSIAAICMAYFCVTSVTTPIQFEDTRMAREVAVIKNLVDLRTAEVEFHHQNGRFTASYDTLLTFLKTAPKKELLKEGSLTDKQLEAGLTEHKAVKILNEAKKKALKKNQFESIDALYTYIWENDADVKKNELQGFRRDTIELNMLEALYKGEYTVETIDQITYIPYNEEQKQYELEVNNDYKTSQGIRVPLFEARAPYESYLGDLNRQELVNLIDREQKLDHYAGLKVGDIYAPNNNAGNWE